MTTDEEWKRMEEERERNRANDRDHLIKIITPLANDISVSDILERGKELGMHYLFESTKDKEVLPLMHSSRGQYFTVHDGHKVILANPSASLMELCQMYSAVDHDEPFSWEDKHGKSHSIKPVFAHLYSLPSNTALIDQECICFMHKFMQEQVPTITQFGELFCSVDISGEGLAENMLIFNRESVDKAMKRLEELFDLPVKERVDAFTRMMVQDSICKIDLAPKQLDRLHIIPYIGHPNWSEYQFLAPRAGITKKA